MSAWEEWVNALEDEAHRAYMRTVFTWVEETYPQLECAIKWKQPMFMDHGTFIIGFSVSSKNMLVAPEGEVTERFGEQIVAAGYTHGKKLVRFGFHQDVNYELLSLFIETNIREKQDVTTFWR